MPKVGYFYNRPPFLNNDNMMNSYNSNSNQVVTFDPAVGTMYNYEFNDTREVVQEIGNSENKIKVTTGSKTAFSLEIIEKTQNGFIISVTFSSCEIDNSTGDNSINAVSEDESTHSCRNIESFKGLVFNLSRTEKEGMKIISGYKEYLNKSTAAHENALSEEYFTDIFEQILEVLPDQNISTGYSWQKEHFRRSQVKYLTNIFRLDSIYQNIAYINTSSDVEQEVSALNHHLLLTGKEQGDIEVETDTGMLIYCNKKTKLDGICKIGDVNVHQSVINTCEIIGHRTGMSW
jgi:hypothetical protein